ncbi:Repressor of RNA polymerase III transcription Maf1 [Carpediemonas membranifera]|uniref:Repressor of RNA polymerase III transcription Maf1 n=1 Tax=Carpediemonas membranifera TaxID=201153 RepID=A0A8J6AYC9_9EUKA|nr:Repressor of RNA polymerase III transcription Maf1 [Carpediemonas membranifera]|eukprot:KAG9391428.1 Repressor of RNA polymerase III transcription Maf1 [Carpediemonas membranifera]
MKGAASEKKISRSLEDDIISSSYQDNPFDVISNNKGRKMYINLIHTLNSVFPSNDFTYVTPDHFVAEPSAHVIAEFLLSRFEGIPGGRELISETLSTLDLAIMVKDCEIYSLATEDDLFGDEALWSFCFFFHNPKTRRIAVFACRAVPYGNLLDCWSDHEVCHDVYYDVY